MRLIAQPQGPEIDWFIATEITNVHYDWPKLKIRIEAARGDGRFAEVCFSRVIAFQAIPEGDMSSYWLEPLGSGRFAYRVEAGGWLERTADHYFQVTSAPPTPTEWLVVADCGLVVTVLSAEPPSIGLCGSA
jgi:hypothetical protein